MDINRRSAQRKAVFGLLFSAVLIFMDQLTKRLAVENLKNQASVPVWRGVFELHYLENHGAAFGLLQNRRGFFLVTTAILLVLIVFFYFRQIPDESRYRPLNLVAVLFFAGAIGNFIDRVKTGYVVDFFYFVLIDFPIFNVADIYVVVAAFLLIVLGIFYYKEDDFERLLTLRRKSELG